MELIFSMGSMWAREAAADKPAGQRASATSMKATANGPTPETSTTSRREKETGGLAHGGKAATATTSRTTAVTSAAAAAVPKGKGLRAAAAGSIERRAAEDGIARDMQALGLGGALGIDQADVWEAGGDEGSRREVEALRESMRRRVMATWDLGRVGSALAWWRDFRAAVKRVPFMKMEYAGDLRATVYNNITLDLFVEFIRKRGPRSTAWGARGKALSADYIQSTAATIRLLRSGEAHYDVAPTSGNTARPKALKEMRRADGPRGVRKESRGFRARDFKQAARTMSRITRRGRMEWGVGMAAHSMLLRGGEVGRVARQAFQPARGITIASVQKMAPSASSRMLPWAVLDVCAAKDQSARAKPVPMGVRKRRHGSGDDPLCAYTAIMNVYDMRCADVPACQGACAWCKPTFGARKPAGVPPASCKRANAPLFLNENATAYDTADVAKLGKKFCRAAGIPPELCGAKLWRIGGATDLRDTMGMQGAQAIKERGRWGSDVAFVYARSLVGQQLDAAAGMAEAGDADVEAMFADWVQPAAF